MAIQMARAFGARVATTAGSDEKCSFCRGLGAEIGSTIGPNTAGGLGAEVARWAQPHGLDAILDMIGGDYFPKHLDCWPPVAGWYTSPPPTAARLPPTCGPSW